MKSQVELPQQSLFSSQADPLPRQALQVRSQRPLLHWLSDVHSVPFGHLPQSRLHSRPVFEPPQSSVPLQLPSPHDGGGFAHTTAQ
jgi:hypothetical protein